MRNNNSEAAAIESAKAAFARLRSEGTCKHEYQEQPGEPPVDICIQCGAVRE